MYDVKELKRQQADLNVRVKAITDKHGGMSPVRADGDDWTKYQVLRKERDILYEKISRISWWTWNDFHATESDK